MKSRISHKSEAIVLRCLDYGESDRIVTFYTAEFGKVKGIAKGARRSKKRFANALEPFVSLLLLFSRPSYEGLALIEEGKVINHFPRIREDLKKTLLVSYLLDLTDQFSMEGKTNRDLFNLLHNFLELIDPGTVSEDLARFFEMRLLTIMGYEPVLDRCMSCKEPLLNGRTYHFSLKEGGIICSGCSPSGFELLSLSTGAIKSLLLGKYMEKEQLPRLILSQQSSRESRHFLERFITHLLGKELKSLRVLREVREMGI